MTKTLIRFKAKLFRPAESEKAGSWTFLVLPKMPVRSSPREA